MSEIHPEMVAEEAYLRAYSAEKRKRGYHEVADEIDAVLARRKRQVSEEPESRQIVRVGTNRRGRPPHIEIQGGSTVRDEECAEPKILGAKIPGEPVILDSTTKNEEEAPIAIRQHEEHTIEGEESIRQRKEDPTAPQVRVRANKGTFEDVKRGKE